jgi:hypothetical protein
VTQEAKWIGFPKGNFLVVETFLKSAKIPYLQILHRAAVVQFAELSEENLKILEANDWVVSKIPPKE